MKPMKSRSSLRVQLSLCAYSAPRTQDAELCKICPLISAETAPEATDFSPVKVGSSAEHSHVHASDLRKKKKKFSFSGMFSVTFTDSQSICIGNGGAGRNWQRDISS